MNRIAVILATAALAITSALALTYSFQHDDSQAQIVKLEKRIAELECRHVMYEDGSTLHADAERVAECVYTAPVFARYGD
jgi:hypothetical protein